MHSPDTDLTKAAEYTLEAADARKHALHLAQFAAEIVEHALALPDSSPKRRAGLDLARCLREAANSYTDSAEQYEGYAADHLVHANMPRPVPA